jgi:hypothetical protein
LQFTIVGAENTPRSKADEADKINAAKSTLIVTRDTHSNTAYKGFGPDGTTYNIDDPKLWHAWLLRCTKIRLEKSECKNLPDPLSLQSTILLSDPNVQHLVASCALDDFLRNS